MSLCNVCFSICAPNARKRGIRYLCMCSAHFDLTLILSLLGLWVSEYMILDDWYCLCVSWDAFCVHCRTMVEARRGSELEMPGIAVRHHGDALLRHVFSWISFWIFF